MRADADAGVRAEQDVAYDADGVTSDVRQSHAGIMSERVAGADLERGAEGAAEPHAAAGAVAFARAAGVACASERANSHTIEDTEQQPRIAGDSGAGISTIEAADDGGQLRELAVHE